MDENERNWLDRVEQGLYYEELVNSENPEALMQMWTAWYEHDPRKQENWRKAWTAYTNMQHTAANTTPKGIGKTSQVSVPKVSNVVYQDNRDNAVLPTPTVTVRDIVSGDAGGDGGSDTGGGDKTDITSEPASGTETGANTSGNGGSESGGGNTTDGKTQFQVNPGIQAAADEGDRIVKEAAEALLNRLNTKFQYSATGSPLYGILREQYEREAERASGRAYARATANAGGYGSSYATLAGEEAARQVMEGFDDNQMALYEAARAEYEAETQSLSDRYTLALREQERRNAALAEEEARVAELNEDAKLTATTGMNKEARAAYSQVLASGLWTGSNPEQVSSYLTNAGYDEEAVGQAIAALERNAKAIAKDQDTYRAGLTEPQQEIYDIVSYLYTEAGGDYDKFMEEFGKNRVYRYPEWKQDDVDKALRTFFDKQESKEQWGEAGTPSEETLALAEDILARRRNGENDTYITDVLVMNGKTPEEIQAAFGVLGRLEAADLAGDVEIFKENPTLDVATALIERAKKTGDYATVQMVQDVIGSSFRKACSNPETAYEFLGVGEEAWKELSKEDKIAKISEAALSEWKVGRISHSQYNDVLVAEINHDLDQIERSDLSDIEKRKAVIDIVVGLSNKYENGELVTARQANGVPYTNCLLDAIIGRSWVRDMFDGGNNYADFEDLFKGMAAALGIDRWDDEDKAEFAIMGYYQNGTNPYT